MTSPSKILLVFPVAELGGAERVFMALVQHLDRRRFEPVAWFLRPGPLVEQVRALGAKVVLQAITRLSDPRNLWRTVAWGRRLIEVERISLVFSSLGYGHLYGGLAAWRAGVKAIWWQHGLASPMNWIDRMASRIPSALIITSSQAAARAQAEAFGGHGRVEVIYPGVEVASDAPDPAWARLSVRREFGLAPDSVLIACVSRLQPGKGQIVLLRAASEMLWRFPQVKILLVGGEMFGMNPGYERRLKRLTRELGIEDRVVFTGFRQDIARLLAAIDIFVHPATAPESFGLSVVEAMAAGKPVIVTDVGGPRETVVDGQTGLIVPPHDERRLREAMITLLENPQLGQSLGRAAQIHARAQFSQSAMIEKVEAALLRALGG